MSGKVYLLRDRQIVARCMNLKSAESFRKALVDKWRGKDKTAVLVHEPKPYWSLRLKGREVHRVHIIDGRHCKNWQAQVDQVSPIKVLRSKEVL